MSKNGVKAKSSAKSGASSLYYDLDLAVRVHKSKGKAKSGGKSKVKVSH